MSGSDDKTVKLWDMQTGGVVTTFSGHTHFVSCASISADHTTVASGSSDYTIRLWDIKTGGCYHTIEQHAAVCIMFSPIDPQHLISIYSGELWQWNANGHQIRPPFASQHASFSSDGARFFSRYMNTFTAHDSHSGATISELQIPECHHHGCSFSPDGKLVAIDYGGVVHCWNIANSEPQLVESFVGHTVPITSLVFSSPSILISAATDKSVKFWQIGAQSADPAVIDPKYAPLPVASIESITLQAKDGIVITSDYLGMVKTWDISTGIHKASFQTPAKYYTKRDIQLINETLILVYYGNGSFCVWDAGNEKLLLEVGEDYEGIFDLKISGDGSKFYCFHYSSIRAWSIQTGEAMGEVKIEYSKGPGSLIVDGSKVWAHRPQSGYEGWEFGISGSAPIKLSGMPILCNGSMLWDPRQGKVKDVVTGGVIFQLTGRFANPTLVQCDGLYLVASYRSDEILILELKHVPL